MAETKTKPAARAPTRKRKPKGPNRDELKRLVAIGDEFAPTQRVALLHRLETEEGAKTATTTNGIATFTLAGFKAQSTAGTTDALSNWMNKARRILRGVA